MAASSLLVTGEVLHIFFDSFGSIASTIFNCTFLIIGSLSSGFSKKSQGGTGAEFAEYFGSGRVFTQYLAYSEQNFPSICCLTTAPY